MPTYSRYSPVGGGTSYTFTGVLPITVTEVLGTVTTSMTQADATTDGWLSAADWSNFDSKQSALTFGNLTELTSSVLTISGGTGAVIGSGTTIQVLQSGAAQDGYLSSADWNTFNSKQNALSFGNLSETGSSILTITGGAGAVIGSGTTIQVAQANTTTNGFLSSTDWNTFNNKQPAGTYVTSVTGSAPVSSTGGTTPAISISQSGVATDGYLSSIDWNTFNNKATYPTQTGNTDKVLATDGTNVSWQYAGLGSGSFASGTVVLGRAKPASLTGADNIIIGDNAGNALSNQTKHIAIGTSALSSFNVSVANEPNQSVAIGYESLKVINSASQNWGMVAVGYRAGYAATSGDGAVLIGFSAGNNGTGFGRCVYVGRQAGGGGSINTGIGMASLRACTGSSNSALGDSSLSNVSTGGANIGIGVNAGNSPTGGATLTTGSSNIIIGEQAGVLTASTSNAIALGRASVAGANEFSVGSNAYQINTVLLGQGGASQTTANAVKIQTMRASGTNTDMSVGTLTLAGAQGTGTGPGGDVIISTAPAGASGSTLNNHVERIRAKSATEVVVNDTGVDFDFRVEGDADANLLFVDAGADRVGIGNNTPAEKLHVSGNIKLVSALLDGSVSGTLTQSAADTTTSYAVKWPSAQGASTTILQNDGSGNLSWVSGLSLPTQTGNSGKFLITDGSNTSWDTVVNDSGADLDFRVEGDTDANLLFTDASTDRVGVGTNAPNTKLEVQQETATTNAVTNVLRINSQSSGTPANGIGVGVEFAAETAAGNTEIGATIEAITTDVTSASEDFDLSFKTMAAGAAAAERMRVTSTGDFKFDSGYGSVETAYGCRAWVNFNGTSTVTIREDGNVSSITDNGTGDYTINFTTSMPDANYAATFCGGAFTGGSGNGQNVLVNTYSFTASAFTFGVLNTSAANVDRDAVCVAILR